MNPVKGSLLSPCDLNLVLYNQPGQEFNAPRYDKYGNVAYRHLGVDLSPKDPSKKISIVASHDGLAIIVYPANGVGCVNWPGYGPVLGDLGPGRYGNHVLIDSQKGYATLYVHLERIIIAPGQRVKRGQVLGYMGNTGYSTGKHHHNELLVNYKAALAYNSTNDRVDASLYWGSGGGVQNIAALGGNDVASIITVMGSKKNWVGNGTTRRLIASAKEREELVRSKQVIDGTIRAVSPATLAALIEVKA